MARTGQADEAGRLHARVDVAGSGEASVATGVPVFDHLIGLMAQYGSFDIALEIAPGEAEAEIAAAGRALGRALERRCGPKGRGATALRSYRRTRRSRTLPSRLRAGRSWSRT